MRLKRLDIFEAKFPFRISFGHALATRTSSSSVITRLESDDGVVGYGECVPRDYVTGETPQSARETLREQLGPRVLGSELVRMEDAPSLIQEAVTSFSRDGSHSAAQCALELAVLDLAGHAFGKSVATLLNQPVRATVTYSGVLPFLAPPFMILGALIHKLYGVTTLKLKVGRSLEEDLRNLRLLRSVLGPRADLRVDANCAWTPDAAIHAIRRMRRYRISAVEQPVAKDDFQGLKSVKDAVDVPIMADESLRTVENARQLADGCMVDMFNVRISKCGGMLAAREIARIAEVAGLMCQLGPHPGEGPLLIAAGRHVAGAMPNLLYCEGDIFDILRKQDVSRRRLRPGRGGVAPLLSGTGLCVDIDERKLEGYVVERDCID